MNGLVAVPAVTSDAERLADIRVATMRPSLEAVGRFDPIRARQRFLVGFDPTETTLLQRGTDLVGFYVVRERTEYLYLDHLYILDAYQRSGLGREIVSIIKDLARKKSAPIRLMALKGSPANHFYASCGFALVTEDEFDNHYEWCP